jgi:hypothetical protein
MPNENKWLTVWQPKRLEPPQIDPQLPKLNSLQRSVESLRYSILKAEYWLSANGSLREWLRLNCRVVVLLGIPALLVIPVITFLLTEFTTWTALLVQIAKNLVIIAVLAITAVLFVARFLRSSR